MTEPVAHATQIRKHEAVGAQPAAFALGFLPVVLLGLHNGGYGPEAWKVAGIGLGATAALGLTLGARRHDAREVVTVAALSGVGALMALSASWGIEGTEAAREAQRCALYVAALAAFLVVVRSSTIRALLVGVLAGVVGLAALALGDYTFSPPERDPYQGVLLFEPVGYANALGLLMALGLVLAIGLLAEERSAAGRAALVAAACPVAVVLWLTSSRGAVLAALAGSIVLVALRRRRGRKLLFAAVALAAVGALVVTLVGFPRATLGDRAAYWDVAVEDAAEHPVLGSGAGSFDDYWLEHRPVPTNVRDAHSLYLETAAELGVVGLVLLLVALGAPLTALARARDARAVSTAAAAYVAFLVHAGLDWDWEMPVTTVAGLACGAAVLVGTRRR